MKKAALGGQSWFLFQEFEQDVIDHCSYALFLGNDFSSPDFSRHTGKKDLLVAGNRVGNGDAFDMVGWLHAAFLCIMHFA